MVLSYANRHCCGRRCLGFIESLREFGDSSSRSKRCDEINQDEQGILPANTHWKQQSEIRADQNPQL